MDKTKLTAIRDELAPEVVRKFNRDNIATYANAFRYGFDACAEIHRAEIEGLEKENKKIYSDGWDDVRIINTQLKAEKARSEKSIQLWQDAMEAWKKASNRNSEIVGEKGVELQAEKARSEMFKKESDTLRAEKAGYKKLYQDLQAEKARSEKERE